MESTLKSFQIQLAHVKQAAERIRPFIHRTPIITSQYFDKISGKRLYFKCENFQKTGSFKIRGATNAILKYTEINKDKKPIIVTHSSGNHAQAIALAAKNSGLSAYVVMPNTSPQVKKDSVEQHGANIVECEPTQEQREITAKKILEKYGDDALFLSSSNHLDVIAGQGTIGLEMLDEVADLEALIVPVSGGGMLSGICIAAKSLNPDIKIFAAEPKNADDCAQSFAAKRLIPNKSPPDTIADGLRINVQEIPWPVIRDTITDVIVVEEQEIIDSMKTVFERMKVVIEPSSAVGVAAVLTDKFKNEYNFEKVGVVLCGGNVDVDRLPWMK